MARADLFRELKRRRVFRVAAMYAVAGWLLLQIGEVTFEPLGLPDGSLRVLIIGVVLGLPIAIVLAWIYDITSEGVVRTQDSSDVDTDARVAEDASESRAARPRIAVLPFENLSGDPAQDYLGDGLAEDLITRIAAWDLRVLARNSSFAFRDGPRDVREISQRLDVRYVVEGSIRRVGEMVRVTAQLIEGDTGDHVWAESYDRPASDLLEIRDEILLSILSSMGARLSRHERQRAAGGPKHDTDAWDLYMRAMWHSSKIEPADIEHGIDLARRATEIDPLFAEAWAIRSTAVAKAVQRLLRPKPAEAIAEALDAARRALSLSPDLHLAHMALGVACALDRDRVAAERHLRRAIELEPEWPVAHNALGWMLAMSDEPERAIEPLERGLEITPPGVLAIDPHFNLALACFGLGRLDEAIEHLDEALSQRADPVFLVFRAALLATAGRESEAREILERFPPFRVSQLEPIATYWDESLKERLYEAFRRAGCR